MYKKILILSLFVNISLYADSELELLKQQLKQQQKMTNALLKRVEAMEKQSAIIKKETIAIKKHTQEKEDSQLEAKMASNSSSSSFSQNEYLPDMAFVLNMSAVSRNVKNTDYENLAIPGFVDSGDAELPFNKNRGFNLNYAEVALHSNVDPYFEAFAIFHISEEDFEIEEAFVNTTALPYGFRIKAGKFRSAFGRLNEKHHHSWSFDEQTLIYKSLFGPDGINDDGIQLQWVAPTDTYIMAGVEAMQGRNDRSFGDQEENNLYVGYLKSSLDFTDDLSVLAGASIAHGKTASQDSSDVYGVDLTFREQLGSYSSLVLQSEYLQRDMDNNVTSKTEKQAGFYTQLVYQYNNNYSTGIRYDKITKNDADLSAYNNIDTDNLEKYTAMIEYKAFPFSRLRLEYSHDKTKIIDNERKDINTIIFSLNIAAGAHGAHSY